MAAQSGSMGIGAHAVTRTTWPIGWAGHTGSV